MDIRSGGGGSSAIKVYGWDQAGKVLNGVASPYTPIDIYKNGVKDGSTTANAQGAWSYTFGTAPAPTDSVGLAPVFGGSVQGRPVYVAPVLQTLALSRNTAVAGSGYTATISNKTAGSTITAASSDGTQATVSSDGTSVSGTFSAAGTPTLTLTETLAGATGSPKQTQVQITVSAAPVNPTLAALGLANTAPTAGTAYSSAIQGATAGSTISATSSDGTALTVSGTTLSGTFSTAGTPSITLVETLAGATNSPRTTTVQVTVAAASSVPPGFDLLTGSDGQQLSGSDNQDLYGVAA